MGTAPILPLQEREEERKLTPHAPGTENRPHGGKGLRQSCSQYRDINENRGMDAALQEREGGVPDVCHPPAAPSPGELWLPPPASSFFSPYPPLRATFLFCFQFLTFSSFPSCKSVGLNSFHFPLLFVLFFKKFGNYDKLCK